MKVSICGGSGKDGIIIDKLSVICGFQDDDSDTVSVRVYGEPQDLSQKVKEDREKTAYQDLQSFLFEIICAGIV